MNIHVHNLKVWDVLFEKLVILCGLLTEGSYRMKTLGVTVALESITPTRFAHFIVLQSLSKMDSVDFF